MASKPHGVKVSFPGMNGAEVLRYSPTVVAVPAKEARGEKEPAVILIMRWMDAADAHASKYMRQYSVLYPGATQIVVASPQKYLWLGDAYREKETEVVAELLREHGVDAEDPKSAPLLVHTFSNGGSLTLVSLARTILRTRPHSPTPSSAPAIPARALIYDSCPGPITVRGGAFAFSMVFRRPWQRWVGWYVVFALLWARKAVNGALGYPDATERMREDLLDPELLPGDVPRTYIYSTRDKIVPYESVEEMIGEEKKLGRSVHSERFTDTQHVAHARGDEGRYWGAVKRTWEEGMSAGE